MLIITTLEEPGVREYSMLLETIRRHDSGARQLRTVALLGDALPESRRIIGERVDEACDFRQFNSYKRYEAHEKAIGHPIGKFAKLFLVREYLERNRVADDAPVLFLDPDTFVQGDLRSLAELADGGILLFGHEIEQVHYANAPNQRLAVAERFDAPGVWGATYFCEINTGVILGRAAVFRDVLRRFETFVENSEYHIGAVADLDEHHWHDQDFFRYFVRKTLPRDVAVLNLSIVFTTTKGALKCVRYEPDTGRFATAWGVTPMIIHFAGGTLGRISGVPESWMRIKLPPRQGVSPGERVKRALETSPLDVARFIRSKARSWFRVE